MAIQLWKFLFFQKHLYNESAIYRGLYMPFLVDKLFYK